MKTKSAIAVLFVLVIIIAGVFLLGGGSGGDDGTLNGNTTNGTNGTPTVGTANGGGGSGGSGSGSGTNGSGSGTGTPTGGSGSGSGTGTSGGTGSGGGSNNLGGGGAGGTGPWSSGGVCGASCGPLFGNWQTGGNGFSWNLEGLGLSSGPTGSNQNPGGNTSQYTLPGYVGYTGHNDNNYRKIWSEDAEKEGTEGLYTGGETTDQKIQNYKQGNYDTSEEEQVKTFLNYSDWQWERTTQLADDWNKDNVDNYDSGGMDLSRAPRGTYVQDSGPVKDAFVRFYSIQQSTRIRKADPTNADPAVQKLILSSGGIGLGPAKTFVKPDGKVLAVTDYRINHSYSDTSGAGYPKYDYWVANDKATVVLYAQGKKDSNGNRPEVPIGTDIASDGVAKIDYTGVTASQLPGINVVDRFKLEVYVSGDIKEEKTTKVSHTHDSNNDNNDGSNDDSSSDSPPPCETGSWYGPATGCATISISGSAPGTTGGVPLSDDDGTVDTDLRTESTTTVVNSFNRSFSRTENVQVVQSDPQAQVAKMPDGTMQIYINTSGYWSRIYMPDNGYVKNIWSFYGRSKFGWGDRYAEYNGTNDPNMTNGSLLRPTRIFLLPPEYTTIKSPDTNATLEVTQWSYDVPAPRMYENVSLAQPMQYNRPQNLLITFPKYQPQVETTAVTVDESQDLTYDRKVSPHNVKVSMNIVDANPSNDTATVRVMVTDKETGAPVRTRPNTLEVQNKDVSTNSSGMWVGEVSYPFDGYIEAEFKPKPWYSVTGQPYTGDADDSVTVTSQTKSDNLFFVALDFLIRLLALCFPLLLILFVGDKITSLDLWPPWRGFTEYKWE